MIVDNITEFICDRCKGTCHEPTQYLDNFTIEICDKCLGHGKLDWIENVVGKRKTKLYVGDLPSHTHLCSWRPTSLVGVILLNEKNKY